MELLKALEEKKALKQKVSKELEQYKACDPERLSELRMSTETLCISTVHTLKLCFCRQADDSGSRGS